ncbi:hypothetical protein SAMN04488007_0289 [Maribacter aquivivus]|uniref:Uncharacterized protein n=1 Tax=Maribacter aquivivus TaxID=228958 RepID=A0A1M6J6N6_9FLAO|nr:hypothetical protein [Maribacter aquivivus]SHJ42383.1 hypothetical protein SAMN04488007_0289 [Maribacter aquivivus]
MLKKVLFIIFLTAQSAFSQVEKVDYELYSLIISEQLEFGIKSSIDSVLLIEQFENKFDNLYDVFNSKSDSISKSDINFISINTGNDTIFIKRLIQESKFRNSVKRLTTDFGLSPKINANLLSTEKLNIQSITSKKYYSIFGKKFKRKNPWKRIIKKYGTKNIIEFSKVKYNGNLASAYFGFHCGGLCGNGRVVIFEKVNGVWEILTSINQWES